MKLHLGCGKRDFGEGWVHIDGGNYGHLRSRDITTLPFEDGTVELVYASHVLEYFDREEAIDVLEEWKRVLVPEGTLRVAVPDFEAMVRLYAETTISLNKLLGPLYGKMDMDDKKIYHKTVYDESDLKVFLFQNGFRDIVLYDWRNTEHSHIDDHSQAYLPHMDKENGTLISLNIECRKNV
jgi:predicted SAM-dependent methyltransferase